MSTFSRRRWLQQSLLATTALAFGTPALARQVSSAPAKGSTYDFADILKLNWNENPYGPSKKALEAGIDALRRTNMYPDQEIEALTKSLATYLGVGTDEVLLTSGSTEVLSLMGLHVGLLKGEVVTPWPSFPTLLHFAEVAGGSAKHVPLDAAGKVDLDALLQNIGPNTRLVFICNPNNPSSTEVSHEDLRQFCRRVPSNVMILVDEAYIEFSKGGAEASLVPMISELPNLVIARTFSKAYGLAGIRIGYAVSQQMNIDVLRERHNGFGMGLTMASTVMARTALEDQDFIKSGVKKNDQARQIVYSAFDKWGVQHSQSSTNFIYAREEHFVKDVVGKLRQRNVLITKWPIMKDHIRISLGTPDDMHAFVNIMGEYLA